MRAQQRTNTHGERWIELFFLSVTHLLEVLHVVFGGCKHHRLLVGPHYVPQQMEQHRRLVVHAQMEEGQLMKGDVTKRGFSPVLQRPIYESFLGKQYSKRFCLQWSSLIT